MLGSPGISNMDESEILPGMGMGMHIYIQVSIESGCWIAFMMGSIEDSEYAYNVYAKSCSRRMHVRMMSTLEGRTGDSRCESRVT